MSSAGSARNIKQEKIQKTVSKQESQDDKISIPPQQPSQQSIAQNEKSQHSQQPSLDSQQRSQNSHKPSYQSQNQNHETVNEQPAHAEESDYELTKKEKSREIDSKQETKKVPSKDNDNPKTDKSVKSKDEEKPSKVEKSSKGKQQNEEPQDKNFQLPPMPKFQALPLREYYDNNLSAILLEGLKELGRERPTNPIKFLGEFLLAHDPEKKKK